MLKTGNVTSFFVILLFFFLLNVVAGLLSYFIMFFIAVFIYLKLCRLEDRHAKQLLFPVKFDRKNAIVCAGIGVLLSFSLWGITALQLMVTNFFVSSENITALGFNDREIKNQHFETLPSYIILSAYFYNSLKAIILGPFIEELYFRGLIIRLWTRKYNYLLAVVLSSLAFMLIHNHSELYASIFIHGIVFCLICLKYKHTIYSFIAHSSYNFSISVFNIVGISDLFLAKTNDQISNFSAWTTELVILLISMVIITALLVPNFIQTMRKN